MIVLGLTGSIAMGKSTIAAMLEKEGVPVHDSDAAVHTLMQPGGEAVPMIAEAFPVFKYPEVYDKKKNNIKPINRSKLGALVFAEGNEELLEELEDIVHPLVRKSQQDFIRRHKKTEIVALDIPLLYETGAEQNVDYVLVVSAPYHIQRQRVLDREGMTEEKFEAILERQVSDQEKRARADFIVDTGLGHAHSMKQIKEILLGLRDKKKAS